MTLYERLVRDLTNYATAFHPRRRLRLEFKLPSIRFQLVYSLSNTLGASSQ
jgi:hypothetical protein